MGRPSSIADLTDRELEVFRLIGEGHSTRRIAEELHISAKPGHRFFFDSEEIEPIADAMPKREAERAAPKILVACIGNIFLGDDGFGVEVAKKLASCELPTEVRVVDFGIRGFDLAYALQDGYETTILVDAYPHGQPPGTISLVEPDVSKLDEPSQGVVETHGMNPLNVLRMATAMNGRLKKILLVGCEPESFGGEEGRMGLSHAVEDAVDQALGLIVSQIERILQDSR